MKRIFLSSIALLISITVHAQYSNEEYVHELFRLSSTQEIPAIILINGNLSTATFGKIECMDSSEGIIEIPFLYHHLGRLDFRLGDYRRLSKIPDSNQVKIWLCLKSPVFTKTITYWDTMMVAGTFYMKNLCLNDKSQYIKIEITTLKKKYYKITLWSDWINITYKDSIPNSLWRKRIDAKDWKIYHRRFGVWGPPCW